MAQAGPRAGPGMIRPSPDRPPPRRSPAAPADAPPPSGWPWPAGRRGQRVTVLVMLSLRPPRLEPPPHCQTLRPVWPLGPGPGGAAVLPLALTARPGARLSHDS